MKGKLSRKLLKREAIKRRSAGTVIHQGFVRIRENEFVITPLHLCVNYYRAYMPIPKLSKIDGSQPVSRFSPMSPAMLPHG
jgi:hypothetical protein